MTSRLSPGVLGGVPKIRPLTGERGNAPGGRPLVAGGAKIVGRRFTTKVVKMERVCRFYLKGRYRVNENQPSE